MNEAFATIVVPLDLEPDHDRAVAAAAGLAAAGDLPVILVTVSSPGLPDQIDQAELRSTAARHHLDRWSAVVLHDNEPARAISGYLSSLESPLVVMATEVRGMISQLSSVDTAADLLARINGPTLVLGPNVGDAWHPEHSRLVCCVDPDESTVAAMAWTVRWLETFGGRDPYFVTVKPAGSLHDTPSGNNSVDVEQLAARLYSVSGFYADWKVLYDDNPVDGLLAFTEGNVDAMLVVTTERWTDDSRLHLGSTARRLARTSPHPVLVLPHVSPHGTGATSASERFPAHR